MKNENFFQNVYEVVKLIPIGKVSTYGAIAACLGTKGGARMVGWAMNNAHAFKEIPAHRVVNRAGVLTGRHHFTPPEHMQELLEKEGLKIVNNQIQDFENHFWDPGIEILK